MKLVDAKMSAEPSPPWSGLPTPRSPVDAEDSSSVDFPSECLSIYVDQNNSHPLSMNVLTPALSSYLSDDDIATGTIWTSSQVLEQIKPTGLDSFRSTEEMLKVREDQTSTREYSLRQTHSFLSEISSSGSQDCPPPWPSPRTQSTRNKLSSEMTPPSDMTWTHSSKETDGTYTKRSHRGRPPTNDSRKVSINKNKVAAAKCRTNKNLRTEKLRESAHTAIAVNRRLRQEVMDKMEEIQVLHTEVLCHAVHSGCKDPQQLREFLCADKVHDALQDDGPRCEDAYTEVVANYQPLLSAAGSRRRCDEPSLGVGVNRFKHGGEAYQRAENGPRTQLCES